MSNKNTTTNKKNTNKKSDAKQVEQLIAKLDNPENRWNTQVVAVANTQQTDRRLAEIAKQHERAGTEGYDEFGLKIDSNHSKFLSVLTTSPTKMKVLTINARRKFPDTHFTDTNYDLCNRMHSAGLLGRIDNCYFRFSNDAERAAARKLMESALRSQVDEAIAAEKKEQQAKKRASKK